MNRLLRAAPLAALAAAAFATAAAAQAPYRVLSRTALGGEGGWDYLLADGHRLFITRGTHVMVVDANDPKVIGDIPNTPGVHGVALAPRLNRGFTSNGRDTSVTIFDLRTLATIGHVKVTGRNPDAIRYEPVTGRVFTMNGGSSNVTAIDAATGTVAGTIALAGRPEFAVADGRGHLFINLEDKGEIEEIDARAMTSMRHWKLGECEEPSGLAMDVAHHRLFSVCSNKKMAVTDSETGRVVAMVPIGDGPDAAGFDPATQEVFSSNGDGTLTVVHEVSPDSFAVVQTLDTQRGARTMTFDAENNRVYTVTAEFGPAPAPSAENPRPRRTIVPGSFVLLTIGR